MKLALRGRELTVAAGEPLVMGILNIGLDSVADPLMFVSLDEQIERGMRLAADGAQLIDIGVLSGRTDTEPLPVEDEADLLRPLVSALVERGLIVSVDSWRAGALAAALDAGAQLINDTSGLLDPEIAKLAAESGAGLVVMHTRAAPKTINFPSYEDPVADVIHFLRTRIELAQANGVRAEQLIIDPGLDYAKAPHESVTVLRRLGELSVFERPILLAVSRKYFVGMLTGASPQDRLAGTLAALEFGIGAGAQIVRVHDVAAVTRYLRVRSALHGGSDVVMAGDREDERLKWIAPKRAGSAPGPA